MGLPVYVSCTSPLPTRQRLNCRQERKKLFHLARRNCLLLCGVILRYSQCALYRHTKAHHLCKENQQRLSFRYDTTDREEWPACGAEDESDDRQRGSRNPLRLRLLG